MGLLRPPVSPQQHSCVICNSLSFYTFIFKLRIIIVQTLKMCTFYFVQISWILSHFGGVLVHPSATLLGCLVCVNCNSKRFTPIYFNFLMRNKKLYFNCVVVVYVLCLFLTVPWHFLVILTCFLLVIYKINGYLSS